MLCIPCIQEVWYTPPKAGGKKIAGGKLVEKLRNTWRCLLDTRKKNDGLTHPVDISVVDNDISGMNYSSTQNRQHNLAIAHARHCNVCVRLNT